MTPIPRKPAAASPSTTGSLFAPTRRPAVATNSASSASAAAVVDADTARAWARGAEVLAQIRARVTIGILHCTPNTAACLAGGGLLAGLIVAMHGADGAGFYAARDAAPAGAHVLVLQKWTAGLAARIGRAVVVFIGSRAGELCDVAARVLGDRARLVQPKRLAVETSALCHVTTA